MVALANPVEGYIHPKGWVPPAGSLDMYVIRDCADHAATGQGCALDINNGRCDGKVLASSSGKVVYRDDVQGIIRIQYSPAMRFDYAHMSPVLVTVGQTVTQGQQIGEIGDAHDPSITNFSGCHLHYAINLNGVEVDPWPYMNAQEEPMPAFKALGDPIGTFTFVGQHALISPLDTKVIYLQNPDAGPFKVYASLDLKTPDGKSIDQAGNSPALNDRDQVYLVDDPKFGVAAYALRQDGTFTATVGGHSDADLTAAATTARANGISDAAKAAAAVK